MLLLCKFAGLTIWHWVSAGVLYRVVDDFFHFLVPCSFCGELKSIANVIVSMISFSGCLSKLHGKDTDISCYF